MCLVSGTPRAYQWRHEQQLSEDPLPGTRPLTSDIRLPSLIDALFREIEAPRHNLACKMIYVKPTTGDNVINCICLKEEKKNQSVTRIPCIDPIVRVGPSSSPRATSSSVASAMKSVRKGFTMGIGLNFARSCLRSLQYICVCISDKAEIDIKIR